MPGDKACSSSTSVDSGLPNDTRASTNYRETEIVHLEGSVTKCIAADSRIYSICNI